MGAAGVERFEAEGVRGFLHGRGNRHGIVLSHGAGSDCRSAVLTAAAEAFATAGFAALRCDLPFRQARPHGPPPPAAAPRDRQGLRDALAAMRGIVPGRLFLGGHSYGGRQATMLAADDPEAAAGLLLLAYPLHPPRRPEQLRTEHFTRLRTPAVFVHGGRDPFATAEELRAALALIPARTDLILLPGGHDLRGFPAAAPGVVAAFRALMDL